MYKVNPSVCVFADGANTCSVCGDYAPDPTVLRNCSGPREDGSSVVEPPPTPGPGTELSRLLKRFGIEPTPTCACRAKAAEMDAWGCDECEKPERVAEVVAVMRAEAEARGLPFLDVAGQLLVKRAIRNARNA